MSYEDLSHQDFMHQNQYNSDKLNNFHEIADNVKHELIDQNHHEAHELPFYLMRQSPRKYYFYNKQFYFKSN